MMKKEFLIELDRYLQEQKEELMTGANLNAARKTGISPQSGESIEVSCQRVHGDGCWAAMWNVVEGAVGYEVQANPNPARSSDWRVAEMGGTPFFFYQTPFLEDHLWIRVRALFKQGSSHWSDPVRLDADEMDWWRAA